MYSVIKDVRDELIDLARTNAIPDNSYAENSVQIANLFEYYQQLDIRLTALENNSGTVEPEHEEEWPTYIQPTGAHDAYNVGDKITFEGKKYECLINGCVWNPHDYPQGWKLIEEE